MNKDEFVINASEHEKRMLYKRFCKDNNLSINLFEDPYFHSRLNLYNDFYQTNEKWEQMWDMLKDFNTVQDYFEYYDKVKDTIINKIKTCEAYDKFISYNNSNDDIFVKKIKSKFEKRTLYSEVNDKKVFLSIDMKQANFHAMKYYDENIFNRADTWRCFMSYFTPYKYIQDSKYIRQVILGNCNPRRQVSYATFLMCSLYEILEPLNLKCISIEADELVYELDLDKEPLKLFDSFTCDTLTGITQSIKDLIKNTIYEKNIPLTIDIFRLYHIDGTKGYIKRCFIDDESNLYSLKNKLKCFNSVELPFVLRALKNENIKPNDMIFYAGDINRIAILKDPIDVLIPKDLINYKIL